jgi:hypothetical protein
MPKRLNGIFITQKLFNETTGTGMVYAMDICWIKDLTPIDYWSNCHFRNVFSYWERTRCLPYLHGYGLDSFLSYVSKDIKKAYKKGYIKVLKVYKKDIYTINNFVYGSVKVLRECTSSSIYLHLYCLVSHIQDGKYWKITSIVTAFTYLYIEMKWKFLQIEMKFNRFELNWIEFHWIALNWNWILTMKWNENSIYSIVRDCST